MDSHTTPSTHPPRYPPPHVPSTMPPPLAHIVNPQYALSGPPPPLQISVPLTAMPVVAHHPTHSAPYQPLPAPPPPPHHHSQLLHHPPSQPLPHIQHAPLHRPFDQHEHQHPSDHPLRHPPHLPSLNPSHHPPLAPPHPTTSHYYDSAAYAPAARITALESELEKARAEIDRLRLRLAEFEKERAKTESPKVQSRYWTPNEHKRFLEALQKFGAKDVRSIANYVGSRNATQVRTHAQKYFLRRAREAKAGSALQSARKRSMSESDLARVGRSVRTPPGSPVMRERSNPPALFPPTSLPVDAQMTPVSSADPLPGPHAALPPAHARAASPPPVKMQISAPSGPSTAARTGAFVPPLVQRGAEGGAIGRAVGTTGGKPPMEPGKLADNTGINLLSMVASERKMEAENAAPR